MLSGSLNKRGWREEGKGSVTKPYNTLDAGATGVRGHVGIPVIGDLLMHIPAILKLSSAASSQHCVKGRVLHLLELKGEACTACKALGPFDHLICPVQQQGISHVVCQHVQLLSLRSITVRLCLSCVQVMEHLHCHWC